MPQVTVSRYRYESQRNSDHLLSKFIVVLRGKNRSDIERKHLQIRFTIPVWLVGKNKTYYAKGYLTLLKFGSWCLHCYTIPCSWISVDAFCQHSHWQCLPVHLVLASVVDTSSFLCQPIYASIVWQPMARTP